MSCCDCCIHGVFAGNECYCALDNLLDTGDCKDFEHWNEDSAGDLREPRGVV